MLLRWVSLTPSDGLITWFDGLASLLGFSNVDWWVLVFPLMDQCPRFDGLASLLGFSNVDLVGFSVPSDGSISLS